MGWWVAVSWMFALATGAFAGDAVWSVDGTSLHVHRGHLPVRSTLACSPSPADPASRTLGVALVAYSKKQGTMSWGHASLRILSCEGFHVRDVEYESYRLSGWNEAQLREEHNGEAFTRGDWLSTQRGALVLFRNEQPVDGGWYADAQARNREIYEVWLDLEPAQLQAIADRAQAAYASQLDLLRAQADLTQRYNAITRNCTWVFSAFLPEDMVAGKPITPFAWVRKLQDRARALVLHPSHHLVNRWQGTLPDAQPRVRPSLRRSRHVRGERLEALYASLRGKEPQLPFPRGSVASDEF